MMDSVLRRFVMEKPSDCDVDDEYNVDYSFAMEYKGPPVNYTIPRVLPVDVDPIARGARISTASVVKQDLSLPVVQPIVKIDPLKQKLSNKSYIGLQAHASPISVTYSGELDVARVLSINDSHCTPFRVVNVIDSSGELEFSESDECIPRVLNRNGSSGTLGFSDSHGNSCDLSASSVMEFLHDEQNDCSESIAVQEMQVAKSNVNKRSCHRCLVRSRFMEKEVCIVCSAKYCSNCVLRAMGSMPEGRKCITCIGCRIDESKRPALGKSSRMLRRLMTDMGAKEIMRHEMSCEVNQVPSELLVVNGKPLCHEELVQLLRCPNPPKKLKPRKYWYDKQSGLWGKEGEKPCQIITPQLAVGDPIMRNASNGNTNILVNNREITKPELWMMHLAGINCEGEPHFWLSADGSFQEEGQKNVMERVWFKPRIKLLCSILSLPIPVECESSGHGEVDNVADNVVPSNFERKTPYKLLMVGYDKSGTSTIFKQAKIQYKVPFVEDERQNAKFMIQSNLYGYIAILLEERERLEVQTLEEMRIKSMNQPGPSDTHNSYHTDKTNLYSFGPRLKVFSDWLLQVVMSGNLEAFFPAATREYAPLVEELWKDRAFQATYNMRNEMQMLPRVANYFLDRAVEISRADYEPSDMDILYAEGIASSNGIASMEFTFPSLRQNSFMDPADKNDSSQSKYQLIRVHSRSLGEHCKWLEMFEDMDLIIFCVSLTDYDQYTSDTNGVSRNRILESKKLFETIVTHPVCAQKNFLLILNKFDLLEEKIEYVPLTRCEWFHDFNPLISVHHSSSSSKNPIVPLAQRAFHYIATKFKRHFHSLTGNKLYVSRVTGLESDSVDEALKNASEILKWNYVKPNFSMNDWSSGSIEDTTSS